MIDDPTLRSSEDEDAEKEEIGAGNYGKMHENRARREVRPGVTRTTLDEGTTKKMSFANWEDEATARSLGIGNANQIREGQIEEKVQGRVILGSSTPRGQRYDEKVRYQVTMRSSEDEDAEKEESNNEVDRDHWKPEGLRTDQKSTQPGRTIDEEPIRENVKTIGRSPYFDSATVSTKVDEESKISPRPPRPKS